MESIRALVRQTAHSATKFSPCESYRPSSTLRLSRPNQKPKVVNAKSPRFGACRRMRKQATCDLDSGAHTQPRPLEGRGGCEQRHRKVSFPQLLCVGRCCRQRGKRVPDHMRACRRARPHPPRHRCTQTGRPQAKFLVLLGRPWLAHEARPYQPSRRRPPSTQWALRLPGRAARRSCPRASRRSPCRLGLFADGLDARAYCPCSRPLLAGTPACGQHSRALPAPSPSPR